MTTEIKDGSSPRTFNEGVSEIYQKIQDFRDELLSMRLQEGDQDQESTTRAVDGAIAIVISRALQDLSNPLGIIPKAGSEFTRNDIHSFRQVSEKITEISPPDTLPPQARQEMESAFAVHLSKTDKTREGPRTRWALDLIRKALDRLKFLEEQDRKILAEFGGKRSGLSTYEFFKETFEKIWEEDKQLDRMVSGLKSRDLVIPPDIDKIASDIVKKSYSGEDDPDFEHYLDIATALTNERNRCAKIADSIRSPGAANDR